MELLTFDEKSPGRLREDQGSWVCIISTLTRQLELPVLVICTLIFHPVKQVDLLRSAQSTTQP